jgi:hypothetical protein
MNDGHHWDTGVSGMLKKLLSIVPLLPLAMTSSASAQPTTLSCDGSLFEPDGSTHSSISATLTLGSSPSINIGNAPLRTSPISNNKIQLKFATKDFTGEYFHYTRDLFLIYKSGHLARLTCSPH